MGNLSRSFEGYIIGASMTRPKAPGELELVQDFINTLDCETGKDELAPPGALSAWLAEHGIGHSRGKAAPGDLDRAKALREALRDLAESNAEHTPPNPKAIKTLRDSMLHAGVRAELDDQARPTFVATTPGIPGALGYLMGIVLRAMNDGTWARFKVCPRETCRFAFYDQSKNKSGTWCSMAVCGNREKAKEFRLRHAHASS